MDISHRRCSGCGEVVTARLADLGKSALPGPAVVDLGLLAADASIVDDPAGFLTALPVSVRMHLVSVAISDPARTAYELLEADSGQVQVVAVASADHTRFWRLPRGPGLTSGVVVCRLSPAAVRVRLATFGETFGLSAAVTRAVIALYEHCDVRAAARSIGLSFNTMRDYLNIARQSVWAPNLPRLLTWAGVGSLGDAASAESDDVAQALFSLSDRQRRLAGLIADGLSRIEAAQAVGVSEAVAKKELSTIFAATGVCSAIGLARLFAELRGVTIFTQTSKAPEPFPPPYSRRIVVKDLLGRQIVANDYGPPRGQPVLVLHNTMNCRGVDRALVSALQNVGYRPISPDRPGYGDTEPAPAHEMGEAYLERCAHDMARLCDAMGWSRAAWIAHGPVRVALAIRRLRPDLVGAMVIDAPEPDAAAGSRRDGMIPNLKRAFVKRPWAVASLFRVLTALATHQRLTVHMQEWAAKSPADRAAMSDPALLMDFYRKLVPFRQGRLDGLVREQLFQASAPPRPVEAGTSDLTLLIGATDFIHDAAETLNYWRSALPDARFEILPDAGRFISYSHPDAVVDALCMAMQRQKKPAANEGGALPGLTAE